ncbi:hypothetical protein [Ruminococcus sp.]|nr:hypothetical protein [Ruminococcus sp.]MDD7555740.1 hypothetical protein [Ruminococcus sp.]MDY4964300.1 hypothetical protein [Ruminococcus callidus]
MLVWAVLLVFCLLAGIPTRFGADARMLSALSNASAYYTPLGVLL